MLGLMFTSCSRFGRGAMRGMVRSAGEVSFLTEWPTIGLEAADVRLTGAESLPTIAATRPVGAPAPTPEASIISATKTAPSTIVVLRPGFRRRGRACANVRVNFLKIPSPFPTRPFVTLTVSSAANKRPDRRTGPA